jgi:hypothetical protein
MVTPDATPTNTTSINVSTNTNFKGTFAANPTTGIVTVTDAHPAGVYPVTVRAFGPGGPTTKTFMLTVIGTPCGAGLIAGFTNAVDMGVGNPLIAAIGDFNGDGKQDLAVANFYPFAASIRLGDGLGGFSGSTEVSGAHPIYSVAIGDFNGDGKQDLALVQYDTSGKVLIRLGNGLGGFSGSTEVAVGTYPLAIAIGDFNGDGKQDLAVANYDPNTVSIRLGDGLGGFSGSTEVSVGFVPYSIAIGDFNGDGKQDLAVASNGSDTVSIRLGDGLGGFSGSTEVGVDTYPVSVAIGDFNGDGKQDLAVANYGANTVSIRLGDGLGGFSGSTEVSVGSNPYSVAIGDFDGDGKQDLAVANYNSTDTVSIRLGNGFGNFRGATDINAGFHPRSVAIGDFNGDGRQDLAVVNSGSGTVSIRLGQCVTPPTPTPTPSCAPVITQSTSQAITDSLTPCLNPHPPPSGDTHYDNNYWRAFNLANFVGNGGPYYVDTVAFGVAGANNTQPVIVRLYTNAGAPFPGGTRTQIAATTIDVTNAQSGTVVTVPLAATVPAGTSELVMEVFTPNGAAGGHLFHIGANSAPETGLSYWGGCPPTFPPEPTSVHFVFNVYGSCTPQTPTPSPPATPSPSPTPSPSLTPSPTPTPASPTPVSTNISGTISNCANPTPGPVSNVTLTLTGDATTSTTTDVSGFYQFSSIPSWGNYIVTPSKPARPPGPTGINTIDVVATQRHFLNIGTPLSGCRLTAADVNGDSSINTVDVIAIQRFFLVLSTGIANVGKYQFFPLNRAYLPLTGNQTGQNYGALVLGDVATPFAEP